MQQQFNTLTFMIFIVTKKIFYVISAPTYVKLNFFMLHHLNYCQLMTTIMELFPSGLYTKTTLSSRIKIVLIIVKFLRKF